MKLGQSFHEAIEGFVPDAELNLISAGEQGPGIDKGLQEAASFARSSREIRDIIIDGSVYPVV